MTIIQHPSAFEVALNMTDFIIDTDSTIAFSIRYKDTVILSEQYVPDAAWQVRTHKLGRFLAQALWGIWADMGNVDQLYVMGSFDFYVDDALQCSSLVLFSKQMMPGISQPSFLSRTRSKVIRPSDHFSLTCLIPAGEVVSVQMVDADGNFIVAPIFTNTSSSIMPVSLDLRLGVVSAALNTAVENYYDILIGAASYRVLVDRTQYAEIHQFRFKNVYDCPEYVSCTGELSLKGKDTSSTGFMFGIERKFNVTSDDEYTCRSGVIFRGEDYKLWHDFLNTREAQILIEDEWYPIIISKQNYERVFRKNRLQEIEFSFRFADPDQNGIL